MRIVVLACLASLAAGAVLIATSSPATGKEPAVAEMFRQRCSSCHTVPDPEIRTDRAWLDQVNRTA